MSKRITNNKEALKIAVGSLLEKKIIEAGYKSVHDFSRKHGRVVSATMLNRIKNSKHDIKLKTCFEICEILNIKSSSFVIDIEKEIEK